jgi:hypothetical protein
MSNSGGVRDQPEPCSKRGEFYVGLGAGDAESEVEGARSAVKNQGGEEEVSLAQQVAALDHVQKSHQQQKDNAESYHCDQGHAGGGLLLLFYFCWCHFHPPNISVSAISATKIIQLVFALPARLAVLEESLS